MGLRTSLVIEYDHDTQSFTFDGDGSREYIRRLYTPESNTWSDDAQEFVLADLEEAQALDALKALGVHVPDEAWHNR